jgi:hypothetical protein
MRGICVLLALILAVGMFPNDAEAGRSGCRSCKSGKAKRQYRLRTRVSTVSKSACSGGSCAAPATRTIEKTKLKTVTKGNRQAVLEAWCREECLAMQRMGRVCHPNGTPTHLGVRACGTGMNGRTCMFNGPVLAEAHVGQYSVRVW